MVKTITIRPRKGKKGPTIKSTKLQPVKLRKGPAIPGKRKTLAKKKPRKVKT